MDILKLDLEPAYTESSDKKAYISLGDETEQDALTETFEEPFYSDEPENDKEIVDSEEERKNDNDDVEVIKVPEEETSIEGAPYTRDHKRPVKKKQIEPPKMGTETVAKLLNTTAQTIREYSDNFDFFLNIERTAAGARRFTSEDIDKLRYIMKVKDEKQFTIKEMQAYLENPEEMQIPSYKQEMEAFQKLVMNMQQGIEKMIMQSAENSRKMLEDKETESAQILRALNEKIEKQDQTIERLKEIVENNHDENNKQQIELLMSMLKEKEQQIEEMKKEVAEKDVKLQELQAKPKKFWGIFG